MGYRSKNAIVVKSALVVGTPMDVGSGAGIGAANQPDVTSSATPASAGGATGTGTANPAIVAVSSNGPSVKVLVVQPRDVHPWWRPGAGAFIATAPVGADTMSLGIATGAATAYQPSVRTGAAPGVATGTGAARSPIAKVMPTARQAAGTGTANQPGITTPGNISVLAGSADGFGAAYDTTGVPLLPGFTHVTIGRSYELATGVPGTGTVFFTPSQWMVNNAVTVPGAAVAAALDVDGRISVALAANTDPGTQPSGSYYAVREEIIGQPQRAYRVRVPHDAGPAIDLSTLPVL